MTEGTRIKIVCTVALAAAATWYVYHSTRYGTFLERLSVLATHDAHQLVVMIAAFSRHPEVSSTAAVVNKLTAFLPAYTRL